ncbi:response regulator [Stenotrophomonas sp.]|uniref:response regulator n=1 Tax=Stenotrophomonas sp. TaxID=69392 RepID=UPI0028AA6578|nr:response regulator [Stenotrophomonas sp.]
MSARVLLVEDESLVAMMVEDCLVELGYEVVALAGTVDGALDALQQQVIDLAVLDVNLGGTMSFPVAQALEARGIPYLFLTGYDRSVIPEPLQHRYGLQKPFRMRDLDSALHSLQAPESGAGTATDGDAPVLR